MSIPGWWWCTAPDGRSGWVPVDLLRRHGAEGEVLEDYDATELTVRLGEEVRVIRSARLALGEQCRRRPRVDCGRVRHLRVKLDRTGVK